MEMTAANIGLSMKKCENFIAASFPEHLFGVHFRLYGFNGPAGGRVVKALYYYSVVFGNPAFDNPVRALHPADFDRPVRDFPVTADNIDEPAHKVGAYGVLAHEKRAARALHCQAELRNIPGFKTSPGFSMSARIVRLEVESPMRLSKYVAMPLKTFFEPDDSLSSTSGPTSFF